MSLPLIAFVLTFFPPLFSFPLPQQRRDISHLAPDTPDTPTAPFSSRTSALGQSTASRTKPCVPLGLFHHQPVQIDSRLS